eukprot:gb/GEZN01014789.1/.p1 GENE.gb/GEZN01014789.1/~~gb/GEZN01014789.1/.p1  ORF type:complete len:172 (-),score=48.95 gb/GEZN01014789.1/:289-804(-)
MASVPSSPARAEDNDQDDAEEGQTKRKKPRKQATNATEKGEKAKGGGTKKKRKSSEMGMTDRAARKKNKGNTKKENQHLSFQKEVREIIIGYGDDPAPLPETEKLMSYMVKEYFANLASKAMSLNGGALFMDKRRGCPLQAGKLQLVVAQHPREAKRTKDILQYCEKQIIQ